MGDGVPALVLADPPSPRTQTLAADRSIHHRSTQRTLVGAQFVSQISKLHSRKYSPPYDRYRLAGDPTRVSSYWLEEEGVAPGFISRHSPLRACACSQSSVRPIACTDGVRR